MILKITQSVKDKGNVYRDEAEYYDNISYARCYCSEDPCVEVKFCDGKTVNFLISDNRSAYLMNDNGKTVERLYKAHNDMPTDREPLCALMQSGSGAVATP